MGSTLRSQHEPTTRADISWPSKPLSRNLFQELYATSSDGLQSLLIIGIRPGFRPRTTEQLADSPMINTQRAPTVRHTSPTKTAGRQRNPASSAPHRRCRTSLPTKPPADGASRSTGVPRRRCRTSTPPKPPPDNKPVAAAALQSRRTVGRQRKPPAPVPVALPYFNADRDRRPVSRRRANRHRCRRPAPGRLARSESGPPDRLRQNQRSPIGRIG